MTAGTPDPKVVTPAVAPAPAFVPAGAGDVLLQLMWLASPALPVGGFSYSEGFESAVESGRVDCDAAAAAWLLDQLHLSLARSDPPAMLAAFEAWRARDSSRVATLNAWVLATRETAE